MPFDRFDFSQRPLRMGVLGASRIVEKAFLLPARDEVVRGKVEVVAIAARDEARAAAYAQEHGIPRAYGSYQELIDAPDIDLVYVALPNSGHAPWSLAALRAGKHVLCEKPFGLHLDEVMECLSAADAHRRLLMEAHHWRYHPLIGVCEEALGQFEEPVSIEAVFDGSINNPKDIRLDPALGPGVLMDFGCYVICWADWAARTIQAKRIEARGGEPVEAPLPRVTRALITEGAPGVDVAAEVELQVGALSAKLRCDFREGTPFSAYVRVQGRGRTLHFESPLIGEGARVDVTVNGSTKTTRTPGPSTYTMQMRALVQALESGQAPLTSGAEIARIQRTLDAIYEAGGIIGRRELRARTLARHPATD